MDRFVGHLSRSGSSGDIRRGVRNSTRKQQRQHRQALVQSGTLTAESDNGGGLDYFDPLMEETTGNVAPQSTANAPTILYEFAGETKRWSEIAEGAKDAVVKILAQSVEFDWKTPWKSSEDSSAIGSGFFVSKDGKIVTNAHVIASAQKVWITLPARGEERYEAEVLGVCFSADLAVLQCEPDTPITTILDIGDSQKVLFGEEVMTLGYPLGMNSIKLTVGIISGRQDNLFQTDAPLNPGNSGGPMLNRQGKVIGINVAIIELSQNVGFAIPSVQLRMIGDNLINRPKSEKVLHSPILGVEYSNGSKSIQQFTGSERTGVYITVCHKGFPCSNAGIREGDLLLSFDGYNLDNFGQAEVPWSRYSRASFNDLVELCTHESTPEVEYFRDGQTLKTKISFKAEDNPTMPILPITRPRYPPFEEIDYDVFAGMVVMQLSVNHIEIFAGSGDPNSGVEFLLPYLTSLERQLQPCVIISSVLAGSELAKDDILNSGMLLRNVNGKDVTTLKEYRAAMLAPVEKPSGVFFTFQTKGNQFAVLNLDKVMKEELELSEMHQFEPSALFESLLGKYHERLGRMKKARAAAQKKTLKATLSKLQAAGVDISSLLQGGQQPDEEEEEEEEEGEVEEGGEEGDDSEVPDLEADPAAEQQ